MINALNQRIERRLTRVAPFGVMRSDAQAVYLITPTIAGRLRGVTREAGSGSRPPPPAAPVRQPGWLNHLIGKADAVITPSPIRLIDGCESLACQATGCR